MYIELSYSDKVVGLKQSTRAIKDGRAVCAYLADDCDQQMKIQFTALCSQHRIEVKKGCTMAQLGQACKIDRGAAVVVIVAETH